MVMLCWARLNPSIFPLSTASWVERRVSTRPARAWSGDRW